MTVFVKKVSTQGATLEIKLDKRELDALLSGNYERDAVVEKEMTERAQGALYGVWKTEARIGIFQQHERPRKVITP